MPVVLFDVFKGTAPRIDPHLLPEGFSQTATNTKLLRGILQAWKAPSTVRATTTGIKTIRRYVVSGTENWITWSNNVESVVNVVPGDTKQRIIWTDPSDGIPKQSRNDKLVFTGNYVKDSTDYFRLGVPAPTVAPAVSITPDAPDAGTEIKYVYAWAHRGRLGGRLGTPISVTVTEEQHALLSGLDTTPDIAGSAWPTSDIKRFRKFIFRLDDTVSPNLYTLVGKIDNDATTFEDTGKTYKRKVTASDFHAAQLAAPTGGTGTAIDGRILTKRDRQYVYCFTYQDSDGTIKRTPISAAATVTNVPDGKYVHVSGMASSSGLSGVSRIKKRVFRKDGGMANYRLVATVPENQTEVWDQKKRINLGKKHTFWVEGAGSAPTTPTATSQAQFEEQLTRSSFYYVFTWVTAWGEESAPSSPSALIEPYPSDQITITLPTSAPSGYGNITHKRVYRTDSSGVFRVLFDADIALATATVTDDVEEADLGAAIESTDWDIPPGDSTTPLIGLCMLPNGVLCGGWGNQVGFSEPGKPYAWPIANQFMLDYQFVGAAVTANGVVIGTTGTPYLCQGHDPASMVPVRIEQMQSCIHRATMVDMGDFAIYASPDGLVAVSGFDAKVITEELLTRDQWQSYVYKADGTVSTLVAAQYERRYVLFYDNGTASGGLLFDPDEKSLVNLTTYATAAFFDVESDKLYLQVGTNVQVWDAGPALTYTWKSGRRLADRAVNFDSARVDASAYPVTFKLYADGTLRHTQTVADNRAFRLPGGYRAFDAEVELSGTADVRHVALATDIRELQ